MQDDISVFNPYILKHWINHSDKLFAYVDDKKFHIYVLKTCDVLKLSRHIRGNVISLTNCDLAISGLGFKLSSEHEKPDDNVISAIKKLSTKTFYRIVTHMIMPFLVLHLDRVIGARTLLFFI